MSFRSANASFHRPDVAIASTAAVWHRAQAGPSADLLPCALGVEE